MYIAGIGENSIVDGEGWRYVIFFQGCLHKCKECHNPETWKLNIGTKQSVQQIIDNLHKFDDSGFFDITFSGGDPFFQAAEVKELARRLKEEGRNIWAYTGFKFDKFLEYIKDGGVETKSLFTDTDKPIVTEDMIELLQYVDVVVDGRFDINKRTVELPYRGSTNQRLIDVQESLKKKKIVLYNID